MPRFRVHLQQYVEEIATITVEASSPEEARTIALDRASDAIWSDGDDAYAAEAYAVRNSLGDLVWER